MAPSDDAPPRGGSRQERTKLWGLGPIEPPGHDVQSRVVNTTPSSHDAIQLLLSEETLSPTTATRNIFRPAEHS